MKIDIITLFPEMFDGPFGESIIKRAIEKNLVEIKTHNLRDWGIGSYKQVDDKPFGGGAGMVTMIEPVYNALKEIKGGNSYVIALSAKGEILKQSKVKDLTKMKHIVMLAGHYEGFDQRILDELVDDVISIGPYVLTGGELPAMVVADAVVRLLPGVLGNDESPISDSYYKDDSSKQYPQYTRPENFTVNGKQLDVPSILLSGHHKEIDLWREKNRK
jgi:tRNA (guanine37-N1)-methyltransferase